MPDRPRPDNEQGVGRFGGAMAVTIQRMGAQPGKNCLSHCNAANISMLPLKNVSCASSSAGFRLAPESSLVVKGGSVKSRRVSQNALRIYPRASDSANVRLQVSILKALNHGTRCYFSTEAQSPVRSLRRDCPARAPSSKNDVPFFSTTMTASGIRVPS